MCRACSRPRRHQQHARPPNIQPSAQPVNNTGSTQVSFASCSSSLPLPDAAHHGSPSACLSIFTLTAPLFVQGGAQNIEASAQPANNSATTQVCLPLDPHRLPFCLLLHLSVFCVSQSLIHVLRCGCCRCPQRSALEMKNKRMSLRREFLFSPLFVSCLCALSHACRSYFELLADHLTQQALAKRRLQRCVPF